jgi:tyrosine-protein phosphatase SIW14
MTCVGSLATISFLSGDGTEMLMAEATTTTVSRRSTRLWADDGERVQPVPPGLAYEPRHDSSSSDDDKEMPLAVPRPALGSLDVRVLSVVDLGIDLSGIFPTSPEDMGKLGMMPAFFIRAGGLIHAIVATCLQEATIVRKVKVDERPINFGAVLPGAIYRSSFPRPENLPFLGTLGLKTVL